MTHMYVINGNVYSVIRRVIHTTDVNMLGVPVDELHFDLMVQTLDLKDVVYEKKSYYVLRCLTNNNMDEVFVRVIDHGVLVFHNYFNAVCCKYFKLLPDRGMTMISLPDVNRPSEICIRDGFISCCSMQNGFKVCTVKNMETGGIVLECFVDRLHFKSFDHILPLYRPSTGVMYFLAKRRANKIELGLFAYKQGDPFPQMVHSLGFGNPDLPRFAGWMTDQVAIFVFGGHYIKFDVGSESYENIKQSIHQWGRNGIYIYNERYLAIQSFCITGAGVIYDTLKSRRYSVSLQSLQSNRVNIAIKGAFCPVKSILVSYQKYRDQNNQIVELFESKYVTNDDHSSPPPEIAYEDGKVVVFSSGFVGIRQNLQEECKKFSHSRAFPVVDNAVVVGETIIPAQRPSDCQECLVYVSELMKNRVKSEGRKRFNPIPLGIKREIEKKRFETLQVIQVKERNQQRPGLPREIMENVLKYLSAGSVLPVVKHVTV